MLAAWRAEIDAEPIPELVDLDTAVAAVVAGMKADEAGAAQAGRPAAPPRSAGRGRGHHRGDVSGVGLGSQNAMPGDTLWGIQKIVDPERAESVEAKIEVESRLQIVRVALATGDTDDRRAGAGGDQHRDRGGPRRGGAAPAPPGAGVPGGEAGRDAARRACRPERTADRATRAPARRRRRPPPPPPASDAPTRRSRWSSPDDPSVSQPVDPDPRTPSEALVPATRVGVGFGGADDSRLGLLRAGGHQGAHRVGAGEHGGRRGRDHRARRRPVTTSRRPRAARACRRPTVRRAGSPARTPRPPVPRARASTPRARRPRAELQTAAAPSPREGAAAVRGWRSAVGEHRVGVAAAVLPADVLGGSGSKAGSCGRIWPSSSSCCRLARSRLHSWKCCSPQSAQSTTMPRTPRDSSRAW